MRCQQREEDGMSGESDPLLPPLQIWLKLGSSRWASLMSLVFRNMKRSCINEVTKIGRLHRQRASDLLLHTKRGNKRGLVQISLDFGGGKEREAIREEKKGEQNEGSRETRRVESEREAAETKRETECWRRTGKGEKNKIKKNKNENWKPDPVKIYRKGKTDLRQSGMSKKYGNHART